MGIINKKLVMIGVFACLVAGAAQAETMVDAQLTLSNHVFDPQEMTLPAGKKIRLTVVNKDSTTAEFESADLDREKVVAANGRTVVYIGPLDAGTYGYFDDFHRDATTGKIIVK